MISYTLVKERFQKSLHTLRCRDCQFSRAEVDAFVFGGAYESIRGGLRSIGACTIPISTLWNSHVSINPHQRPYYLCYTASLTYTIDGVAVWYPGWKLVIYAAILFEIADIRDWINAMMDACRFYAMKWSLWLPIVEVVGASGYRMWKRTIGMACPEIKSVRQTF